MRRLPSSLTAQVERAEIDHVATELFHQELVVPKLIRHLIIAGDLLQKIRPVRFLLGFGVLTEVVVARPLEPYGTALATRIAEELITAGQVEGDQVVAVLCQPVQHAETDVATS